MSRFGRMTKHLLTSVGMDMRGVRALGSVVRKLREFHGITQEELSTLAGCDVKTVRRAERGGRLDMVSMQRIATALEVSYQDTIEGSAGELAKNVLNKRIVLEWNAAFLSGDIAAVLRTFQPHGSMIFTSGAGPPLDGQAVGPTQIRRNIEMFYQAVSITQLRFELRASDDYVYLSGVFELFMRNVDVKVPSVNTVHEFQFEDGKILRLIAFLDGMALRQGSGNLEW